MKTADFGFRLPDRLQPVLPLELRGQRRDDARLAVLHRAERSIDDAHFRDLKSYLRPGDVLVINNSAVIKDRLRGRSSQGPVRLTLYGHHKGGWHAEVSPAKRAKRGSVVRIGGGALRAALLRPSADGMWIVRFEPAKRLYEQLQLHGEHQASGLQRLSKRAGSYQNVYATEPGSLEVPSAGLHFTTEILRQIEELGVEIVPITLHIGLSENYRHVSARNIEDHKVGSEWFRVTRSAAATINRARRRGGRVVAVGTTVIRTLETIAQGKETAPIRPGEGWTDLYIYPGYRYKIVDVMLTNLHQPRSSHLMLVSAFAGKELTLKTYRELVRRKFRFDLFGDSMLII
jgi:S-adenosylmethionine:tRNA ribosyltransferase-isomerase